MRSPFLHSFFSCVPKDTWFCSGTSPFFPSRVPLSLKLPLPACLFCSFLRLTLYIQPRALVSFHFCLSRSLLPPAAALSSSLFFLFTPGHRSPPPRFLSKPVSRRSLSLTSYSLRTPRIILHHWPGRLLARFFTALFGTAEVVLVPPHPRQGDALLPPFSSTTPVAAFFAFLFPSSVSPVPSHVPFHSLASFLYSP